MLEDRTVLMAVAPPVGLTNWWPADNSLADIAGQGAGIAIGGVGYAAGEVGPAFSFTGPGQYVAVTGSSTIQGPRTIEAWVKPDPNTDYGLPIITFGTPGHGDFFGIAGTTGNAAVGQYKLYVDHWGVAAYASTATVTPGAWNHVALAYDGTVTLFYVNGQPAGAVTGGLYNYSLDTATIGGNVIGGTTTKPSFSGEIDELSLYDQPLSASDIQAIYQAGPDGKTNKFFVRSDSPVDGETVNTPPANFTVHFSLPYDPATVQAGALLVNNVPATSVIQSDAQTLTFQYTASPVTAAGPQTMQLTGGAIQAVGTGTRLPDWSRTFIYTPLPVPPSHHIDEFAVPTAASTPDNITLAPDGNVWFTEFNAVTASGGGKIGRITPDGQVTEFETPYAAVRTMVAGPDGNLWFTQNNVYDPTSPPFSGPLASKVGVMTTDGVVLPDRGFTLPAGVDAAFAFASDGTLWISTYWTNKIYHFSQTGEELAEYTTNFGVGTFGAANITVAPDGTVWFTSAVGTGTAKLGRITAGTPPGGVADTFSFGGLGDLFRGLLIGPDGNLWAGAVNSGKIARINLSGQLLGVYSVPGTGGQPYSLAVGPDGDIWFADEAQNRIGRVTLQGQVIVYPTPTSNSGLAIIAAGPGNTLWFSEEVANQIGRFDLGKPPVPVVVLRDANGNPAASFQEGDTVSFDASGTTDPEGDSIVSYQWDFNNDGQFDATGVLVSQAFGDNGVYPVRLKVTDEFGMSTLTVVDVVVSEVQPTATISAGLDTNASGNWTAPEGQQIDLSGQIDDPSSADLHAGISLSWAVTKNGSLYATKFATNWDRDFSLTPDDDATYVVTLAVTDRDGSATASRTIEVTNVAPTAVITSGSVLMAGELDPTFGTYGRVTTDLTADNSVYAAAVQPDGKTVVALSYVHTDGTHDVAVARYLPNGTFDAMFGTGGVALTGLTNAVGLVIQSDSRIVIATSSSLVRLNPDGSRDTTTFGTGGTVSVTGLQFVTAVAPEGDNILVAGLRNGGPTAFALARYTANGTPDLSFGPDQTAIAYASLPVPPRVSLSGLSGQPTVVSALVASGDQILVGGVVNRWSNSNYDNRGPAYAAARFSADGLLDTAFGGPDPLAPATPLQGWAIEPNAADFDNGGGPPAMAVQPDGKVVLVGDHLVRFTAAGVLDTQTGDLPVPLYYLYGQVYNNSVLPLWALHSKAVAAQPDGKLLIAGTLTSEFNPASGTSTDTLEVVRLNADFSPDTTFGTNGDGHVVLGFGQGRGLTVANVLLQPGGNILVVTSSLAATAATDLELVRLAGTTAAPEGAATELTAAATDPNPVDAVNLTYAWTVAGGPWHADSTNGPTFRFTPDSTGTYTVSLTVTDPDGAATSTSESFTVIPNVTITGLPGSTGTPSAPVGMTIGLGSSTDPSQTLSQYTWQVTQPNVALGQYANSVIGFSSQYTATDWSASQALGAPDIATYGDNARAWAPLTPTGGDYLTMGFNTPVYADGVTIWETFGNGFVTQVDALDTNGVYHTVWTGTDTSPAGTASAFRLNWTATSYLVTGVKIYTGVGSNWPEIDAVQVHGWDNPVDVIASGSGPNFRFTPTQTGAYVVDLTARTQAGQMVHDSSTISVTDMTAPNLQAVLSLGGTVTLVATTNDAAQAVLTAVNGLAASTPVATLNVQLSGKIGQVTVNAPANLTLYINGVLTPAGTTIDPDVPALVLNSGNVIVSHVTFTESGNAPTILVSGGQLTLRNDVIQESTGFSDAAIAVTGGTVDLGTASDPGSNTLKVNGSGEFVHNTTTNLIPAVGNTFSVNGTAQTASTLSFTSLSANPTTILLNQPLSVTVRPDGSGTPTGSVDFVDLTSNTDLGSATLSGGSAVLNPTALTVGNHVIQAGYSGDGTFLPSLDTIAVSVQYKFSGYLAPLNANLAMALNRTVPIKFQLTDYYGKAVTSLSAVQSLTIPGGTLSALRYDSTANQFIANWQTKSLPAGTYTVTLTLADGTTYTKPVTLSKNGSSAGLVTAGTVPVTTAVGALLGGDITLFVDNTNGDLTADELARIQDAVTAADAVTAPYGVAVVEVTDPTLADVTLNMDTTSAVGGYAAGVLGCTTDAGQITIINGWNFFAGSDAVGIGSAQYDFETVVTHELGHALGLGHSTDSTSVMYATLNAGTVNRSLKTADLNVPDTDTTGACGLHSAIIPTPAIVMPPIPANTNYASRDAFFALLVGQSPASALMHDRRFNQPASDAAFAARMECDPANRGLVVAAANMPAIGGTPILGAASLDSDDDAISETFLFSDPFQDGRADDAGPSKPAASQPDGEIDFMPNVGVIWLES
jgi:uncharacterized delta-60 repeat protein